MEFERRTIERAMRAVRLGPLTPAGLSPLGQRSVGSAEFVGEGALAAGLVRQVLSERAIEAELMWLFRVGVVRREVDGQGITDRFRLTPLGVRVLDQWRRGHLSALGPIEQLENLLLRWLP